MYITSAGANRRTDIEHTVSVDGKKKNGGTIHRVQFGRRIQEGDVESTDMQPWHR